MIKLILVLLSSATHAFTSVDPNYSNIAYPASETYINIPMPQIVGVVNDANNNPVSGETLAISIDNNFLGNAISDNNGIWAYQLTQSQALSDGAHQITAFATNSQVNLPPSNFILDTSTPDAPVISSPVDGSIVTSYTVTITGTTQPYYKVCLKIDGSQSAISTVADNLGNYVFQITLNNGDHTVATRAKSLAGNFSQYCPDVNFTVSVAGN